LSFCHDAALDLVRAWSHGIKPCSRRRVPNPPCLAAKILRLVLDAGLLVSSPCKWGSCKGGIL